MIERRTRRTLIAGILLCLAVAVAVMTVGRWSEQPDTTLEWGEVSRGDLVETVSATGALEALQTVSVGTQVSGTIARIDVDYNSRVKRGDLLALIDPNVLDSQLEQARADLERSRAEQQDAVRQLAESEPLKKEGYLSDRDLRTLETRVKTTQAQVDSAKAAFARAQRNREYAEITSPIDGLVMQRSVSVGQTVAASFQTPTLFVIAQDLTRMQILANVDESEIGRVKLGQEATFAVGAFPDKTYPAVVRQVRLQPTVTQNVVTYTVVLEAANPTGELLPGMTATVDFIVNEVRNALLVPTSALRVRPPAELRDGANSPTGGAQAAANRADSPIGREGRRQALPPGMGIVWVEDGGRGLRRVLVRQLGSDMTSTAIEPARGEIAEGHRVLVRVQSPEASSDEPRGLLAPPRMRGPRT